jgi:hypothetical protein
MPFTTPAHDPRSGAAGARLAAMYPSMAPSFAQPMANGPYMAPSPFGTPPAMGAPTPMPQMAPMAPAPEMAAQPPGSLPTTNATGGPAAMAEPRASIYTQMYRMGKRMDGPAGPMMMDRFGPQPQPPVDPLAALGQPPASPEPVNPMAHVPQLPPSLMPPDPSQYPPHLRAMQPQQQQRGPMGQMGGRGAQLMDRLHNRQPLAGGGRQRRPQGY